MRMLLLFDDIYELGGVQVLTSKSASSCHKIMNMRRSLFIPRLSLDN